MAGVAGPMLRHSRQSGIRFLTGLAAGGVLAGIMLAVPAYVLGSLLESVLPETARLWLVAAVCAVFGAADLMNRTPHVWRQVPQHLVQRLSPGTLGVTWGFDLGLLVTTQKVVSLIWVAVVAVVLLEPTVAAALLVGVAVLSNVAVTAWSMSAPTSDLRVSRRERKWVTATRRTSGGTLLILFLLTAAQAAQ
ncbi:hypothetical protein [Actinomadura sp. HBU206391]|uniref:hypothetical protein n=1 Tax=Actinomadura sp. HBU206391 TaxID=2731692 RepID=UPI00165068F0|nr:hypothetical protein [Actinomadura sp. HBU206391]MBC6460710.1 hypothetical protein [Actinomadura sp. HBU206391]